MRRCDGFCGSTDEEKRCSARAVAWACGLHAQRNGNWPAALVLSLDMLCRTNSDPGLYVRYLKEQEAARGVRRGYEG